MPRSIISNKGENMTNSKDKRMTYSIEKTNFGYRLDLYHNETVVNTKHVKRIIQAVYILQLIKLEIRPEHVM